MDSVTHVLVGGIVAIFLAGKMDKLSHEKFTKPVLCGIAASLAPDLDVVTRFFSANAYLVNHRVMAHSIFAAIALVLLVGFIFSHIKKQGPSSKYYAIAFAGVFSHLALDIMTANGVMLLYPLSNTMFSFHLLSIVDIILLIILASGIIVMEFVPQKKVKAAGIVMIMITLFLVAKLSMHEYVSYKVSSMEEFSDSYVTPHVFDPFEWRVIVDKDTSYMVADYNLFSGMSSAIELVKPSNKEITASLDSAVVDSFMRVARFPFANVDGGSVKWFDLKHSSDGELGYTVTILVDENMKIIKEMTGF